MPPKKKEGVMTFNQCKIALLIKDLSLLAEFSSYLWRQGSIIFGARNEGQLRIIIDKFKIEWIIKETSGEIEIERI
jgi:hypothetical protein